MSAQPLPRYPFLWRLLHWVSAAVILWAISSGFSILLFRPSEQVVHTIADFNVATTLLFVPVFLFRILLVWRQPKPPTPGLSVRQQRLSDAGHSLIYMLVCCVLVSGVLMMNRPMSVFDWFRFAPILNDQASTQVFFSAHRFSNILLTLAVVGHIAAVVKHHRKGIPLLQKMT